MSARRLMLGALLSCSLAAVLMGCGSFYGAGCRSNGDCQSGQICALGLCQSPGLRTCALDGSCPDGMSCREGVCRREGSKAGCASSKDCDVGYRCMAETCRPDPNYQPCQKEEDCRSNHTCKDGFCTPTPRLDPKPNPNPQAICLPSVQNQSLSHYPSPMAREVAMHPDGKLVATAYLHPSRTVLDIVVLALDSQKVRYVITWREGHLAQLFFSDDGKWLIGVSGARIQFWNVKDGTRSHVLQSPRERNVLRLVSFSPDGRYLKAVAGSRLYVWEVASKTLKVEVSIVETEAIHHASFSIDSSAVNVLTRKTPNLGFARVDIASGQFRRVVLNTLPEQRSLLFLHLTEDAKELFLLQQIGPLSIAVFSTETGKLLRQISLASPIEREFAIRSVFDAKRQWLASASSRRLAVWSSRDGSLLGEVVFGREFPASIWNSMNALMVFAKDTEELLLAGGMQNAVWSFTKKEAPIAKQPPTAVGRAAFHRASTTAVLADGKGVLYVWRPHDKKSFVALKSHIAQSELQLSYAEDDKTLTGLSTNGLLRRWSVADGVLADTSFRPFWLFEGEVWHEVKLGPYGRVIAVHSTHQATKTSRLRVWDLDSGTLIKQLFESNEAAVAVFSFRSDGKVLLATTRQNVGIFRVIAWSLPSGDAIYESKYYSENKKYFKSGRPTGKTQTVTAMALSPDGKRMATAVMQAGWGLDLWRLGDQTPKLLSFDGAVGYPGFRRLRFSAKGKWLAAMTDQVVYIFDVQSGKQVHKFAPDGRIEDFAFRHDERVFACVLNTGKGLVWNLETGKQILTMNSELQVRENHRILFRRDGASIAIGRTNGEIRLWNCPDSP